MASKLNLKKEAKVVRVEIDDFLHRFKELHEQDFNAKNWWLLFEDLDNSLVRWKFEDNVNKSKDAYLIELYEKLHAIIKNSIISADEVDDIYELLKSYLEKILYYLPRTWFGVTKWDKIPFLTYFGFSLVFIVPEYSIAIAFFVAAVGLLVTFYCKASEEKENNTKKKKKDKEFNEKRDAMRKETEQLKKEIITSEENSEEQETSAKTGKIARDRGTQFRIFAAVFGIIAALAITAPIEALLDDECVSTVSQLCLTDIKRFQDWLVFLMGQQVILISSFFALGILFYHGGILALSGELAPLVEEGKKSSAFVSSLIIFLEGIILFIAATTTDDLMRFSLWFFVLLALDIIWLSINLYARIDIMFQWLHLNAILLLFLLFALLLPHQLGIFVAPTYIGTSYWAVLIVFLLRTMIDYKVGWKYWTKIPTEN